MHNIFSFTPATVTQLFTSSCLLKKQKLSKVESVLTSSPSYFFGGFLIFCSDVAQTDTTRHSARIFQTAPPRARASSAPMANQAWRERRALVLALMEQMLDQKRLCRCSFCTFKGWKFIDHDHLTSISRQDRLLKFSFSYGQAQFIIGLIG